MELNLENGTLEDKEIIYILRKKKLLLDIIQKKMEYAYETIESLDEIIKRISPKAVQYDMDRIDTGQVSGGLCQVLLKRDAEQKRQLEEQEKFVYELLVEEEKINRVFQCMSMLEADDFELLDALYIKDWPWQYYAARNEISLSSVGRKKKKALKALRNAYLESCWE